MSIERKKILIEASGCHVHLTQAAIETLFGEGAVLKKRRDLSQPGEYLSEQRVKLVTKDGCVENVAVLGPARASVQVELSKTDCRKLGLTAPVNLSGNLDGASDVMMIGSHGEMKASGSVIVARNHIHMRPQDALEYGVSNGDTVRVEVESDRKVIFEDVPIRVSEKYAPAMHIDFDEANACGYRVGTEAFILYGTPCENKGMSAMDMEQLINEVVKNVCAILNEAQQGKTCGGSGISEISGDTSSCGGPSGSTAAHSEFNGGTLACASETGCSGDIIREKLVTEKIAKELVEACGCGTLRFAKGVIITPAAKDIFKAGHKQIEIV